MGDKGRGTSGAPPLRIIDVASYPSHVPRAYVIFMVLLGGGCQPTAAAQRARCN